ncbi:TRAP transporter small permease subunit [Ferrovibrio sp.]|uniref:TRAP transporter small permease subunit n=1 Tax=Ferrovibrio sp. TaxID=1917215 RepID=UPI001B4A19D1|nr:TRAP transporter small permease subunit [Ferrovibrio sp.]MBP7065197.1 TRAP transporter small permease subunit [Ferrovibrio sp.]
MDRQSFDGRLVFWIDSLNTWVGKFFGWSIVFLTLATSYEVFSRYVLKAPTDWAFDAAYILYGILFMMAGAYALARNGHVRGDWLYRSWQPRIQARWDLLLYFLFFFPGIITLIYSGWDYAAQSWVMKERSLFTPNGPPIYHFKTIIPITGVLLLLQGVAEVLRCLYCIRNNAWPPRLGDVEELEQVLQKQYGAAEAESVEAGR